MNARSLAGTLWISIALFEFVVFTFDIPFPMSNGLYLSHHSSMWARLAALDLGALIVVMRLMPLLPLALGLVTLTVRAPAVRALSLVLGLPMLAGPIYNFWIGYFFNCCSFWHTGAGEGLSEAEGLAKFTSNFALNHHVLPKVPGHAVFVDTEHTILMALALPAMLLSILALCMSEPKKKLQ